MVVWQLLVLSQILSTGIMNYIHSVLLFHFYTDYTDFFGFIFVAVHLFIRVLPAFVYIIVVSVGDQIIHESLFHHTPIM